MSDSNSELNDLFKKAAENYPLRTDGADWEKIARALDEEDTDAGAIPEFIEEGGRTGNRSLILLLLFPLLVIGYFTFRNTGKAATDLNASTGKQVLRGAPHAAATDLSTDQKSDSKADSHLRDKNPPAVETAKASAGTSNDQDSGIRYRKSGTKRSKILSSKKSMRADVSPETLAATNPKTSFSHHTSARKWNYIVSAKTNGKKRLHAIPYQPASNRQTAGKPITGNSINAVVQAAASKKYTYGLPGLWEMSGSDPDARAGFIKKTAANKTDGAVVAKQKKKTSASHYFYAGVLAAPDISTVKFQSVKGAGVTAGILLGYHFSKRFSVESGAYLDVKKYYSKGEYFNTKNVSSLNGVDLLNVNGNCSMIEVPVNLRYDIATGNKHVFFVTSGLSTYFMFHQSYSYEYYVNGWTGNNTYSYTKGMQNWFSIVNASIGYEYELGKMGKLRVEPYLRIPMSGMGTGSLPILSSGLNLGLIRKF